MMPAGLRRVLEGVLRRSLARMDLGARVVAALPPLPRSCDRVEILAIGKAAPAMAAGALRTWGRRIDRALVVTSDGTDASAVEDDPRVTVVRGSHPLPDRRSVAAGEECLARAASISEDRSALLLVLVSGGASSLVAAPAAGVHLANKRAVTRALLRGGASIQEINQVRKHLSRIKGGRLALAAGEASVLTLIASDVVRGRASDVASGPTTADRRSTTAAARRLLRQCAPDHADLPLVAPPRAVPGRSVIVASPEELARTAAAELRSAGCRVRLLPPSQASVDRLAREYLHLTRTLRPGSAVVRAAEPAVDVPAGGRGRGGRSGHLAALVGAKLGADGVVFMAAATDGVDGASGTAGAIVDARTKLDPDLADAIARFDTGSLHRRLGTALPGKPTGHNLADLHVLLRSR